MSSWHHGTMQKHAYELQNKACLYGLLILGPGLGLTRVPGIGLVYSSDMALEFPQRLERRMRSDSSLAGLAHQKCAFIGALYGYRDAIRDSYDFETWLMREVMEFLKSESECHTRKELEVATIVVVELEVGRE
ncbi:hypothetical protein NL676_023870 [Syzygium grande]|nr:hypothetical protein NL676_023870 [Syzygium grande]